MRDGIGASLLRKEDRRFLTGRGRFVDDLATPGALHLFIVRSPHAHARIGNIDARAARTMPGVVAVLTGADMAADRVGPLPPLWVPKSADGRPMAVPPRIALAHRVARHVGEQVAVVAAETWAAAADAAETVAVDYTPLPAVTDGRAALAAGSPQLHDEAPGNLAFRWMRGDAAAVDDAFARAAHVVTVALHNNRLAGCALEPRAAVAEHDAADDRLTLWTTTQVPHQIRRFVAGELGMAEGRVRVIAPDVGGGFGYKGKHYPEETICAWAARRLGRAVRWTASRADGFVSDTQARDHWTDAALALDADGRFLGLRVKTIANLGAWVSTVGAGIPSAIYTALLAGVYRTPAIDVEVRAAFTNTVPTDAYRGAGRPEACYVLERLADAAARKLGLDRAEIRRRNLIPASAMPYATPIGPTYDCGDFPRMLEATLAAADYAGWPARAAAARAAGKRRGFGMACYVESSGVAPSRPAGAMGAQGGFFESATVRVDSTGGVQVALGTHNHGQGHETSFAQIAANRLGIAPAMVDVLEGDTAAVPYGTGTFGSRSIAVGGSALAVAADKVIAKGRRIAAHLLEAAETDVAFANGVFAVAGTDRRLSFAEVAHAAHVPVNLPLETMEPGLHETAFYDPKNFAYSNGAHACEVEVDPETGVVCIVGYWVTDDIGTVINPMIVEGQIHGGLAQGIGQALMEHAVYGDGGQLLAGSFMDYAMPRADDLPMFVAALDESQPCTHNPLGAKGCGESGTIGAPAAVVSAIADALGIGDIAMPATPERVWHALAAAR